MLLPYLSHLSYCWLDPFKLLRTAPGFKEPPGFERWIEDNSRLIYRRVVAQGVVLFELIP
jgi:hypothetical protein